AGEAERASVIDFLALAQVEWPSGLSASSLDRLSRQAGILKGRHIWKTRLQARADQLRRTARRTEDESARTACQRDAELCMTAAGFLDEFFQQIEGLASRSSWRVLARLLHSLVDRFGPTEDDGKGPVLEVIGDLPGLDVAGTSPGPGRARWLVGKQLTRNSLRRNHFQHVGVTASGIMGARGVTFDVVIVPGLIEKGFPRHIPEHSLLTELDREALVQVAPQLGRAELPMQKDRPKEERYLFRIALGSARRAVVLTYARLEENTGRPRMPSRFIADTCAALGVQAESSASKAGLVHSVPLNRRAWDRQEMGLALDAFEYDAAVFAGKGSGSRPIAYLQAISSFFRRAVQMQQARWGQPYFSPYDGKIRSPDLIEDLQRKHSRFGLPVSATRFETYARCPFGYFLRYVLGIGEIEAPSEEFQLPALERGSLVHEALGLLYEERLKGRALGELSPEQMKATLQRAGELLDQVGRVHAENHPATWAAERERTLDEIRALLAHERDHHGAAAPAVFEYAFGFSPPTRCTVGLGPGTEVSFRGRIDR
ncbi:MAG: exodeoxyribonuclease V subunit gamma, partial [Candidatus Brocadiae bacterium]|nr:exodeoxyribonuclease V subunit gamma [Candidatus Brocadiia bacterium]